MMQTSLPKADSKLIPRKNINWMGIVICIASIVFLLIMVLTKLFPCFKTSWSQDFCNRWNEFWFGISASFVAAILFYIVFSAIPKRKKRKEMEYLINYDTNCVLLHLDTMIALLAGKSTSDYIVLEDSFIKELASLDWNKKQTYLMDNSIQKNILECIKFEINNAKNQLETILIRYGSSLTSEEFSILSQDILHSDIIIHINTVSDNSTLTMETKKSIASMLYKLYWKLIDFSLRFKKPSITYSW